MIDESDRLRTPMQTMPGAGPTGSVFGLTGGKPMKPQIPGRTATQAKRCSPVSLRRWPRCCSARCCRFESFPEPGLDGPGIVQPFLAAIRMPDQQAGYLDPAATGFQGGPVFTVMLGVA